MLIPKQIQIGGHTITIVIGDEKYELTEKEAVGEFVARQHEIRLSEIQPKSAIEETYWHEVIEAIVSIYDLDVKHHIIQTLGGALHQVTTSAQGILRIPIPPKKG